MTYTFFRLAAHNGCWNWMNIFPCSFQWSSSRSHFFSAQKRSASTAIACRAHIRKSSKVTRTRVDHFRSDGILHGWLSFRAQLQEQRRKSFINMKKTSKNLKCASQIDESIWTDMIVATNSYEMCVKVHVCSTDWQGILQALVYSRPHAFHPMINVVVWIEKCAPSILERHHHIAAITICRNDCLHTVEKVIRYESA